ncbi:hypothetical protein [Paraburkholderia fynbosensis]|uniref:Uncharacterized protein n=1 Tax=Paraburkholderia fynbosensis TaxID=1200993 RepID=A0A6J5GPE7_9BURK|nr:hypothetical protein [Paraburkholderia fynbosensis]CAB3803185.1 hypothetical protein LMG27177_05404 [Paraburkholderia fynbosensis]
MINLMPIFRRATVSGSAAGCAAAVTAALRAPREGSTPYAPINAIAHCLWPRTAFAETGPSARFTLTGLAINQSAAVFWGIVYEMLLARRRRAAPAHLKRAATIATAGATAALAYAVDYHVVPKRLTPGFEAHLSSRSMFYVYAALAAGLALVALSRDE